jgi:hypothetical protein
VLAAKVAHAQIARENCPIDWEFLRVFSKAANRLSGCLFPPHTQIVPANDGVGCVLLATGTKTITLCEHENGDLIQRAGEPMKAKRGGTIEGRKKFDLARTCPAPSCALGLPNFRSQAEFPRD